MSAVLCLYLISCKISSDDNPVYGSYQMNEIFSSHDAMPLRIANINIPQVYRSPCPGKFRYIFDGKEWMGIIMIKKPAPKGKKSKINVSLSLGFQLNSVRNFAIKLENKF
jgi:hypothetical protein